MKNVLKLRVNKRVIAIFTALILLFSTLHIGLVSFAEDHKTVVHADGTSIGWFYAGDHAITTNVSGVSPDGGCVSVRVINPKSGNSYNYFSTKAFDIATAGLPYNEVNSIWMWMYVPEEHGDMPFRYSRYGDDWVGVHLKTPNIWLIDTNTGTSTAVAPDKDDYITVPAGFKGYIVYDMEASANRDKLVSYKYTGMYLWYKSQTNAKNTTWYYDTVTFSTKKATAVVDEFVNYVPQPVPSYSAKTVLPGQEITFKTESENIAVYYTTDGSKPDINSTKFDVNNPIVITSDTTVKAVSYRAGIYSDILTLDYVVYDENDYKNEILADGSAKGWTYWSSKQDVITKVKGVSADDCCVQVKLKGSIGTSYAWTYAKTKALADVDITPDELKTIHVWVKNPKGNGQIQFKVNYYNNQSTNFSPCDYYLVNALDGTYTKYNQTDAYLPIADGFEGWLVYDLTTSSNREKLITKKYDNLAVSYKLPNMTTGDYFYYDNICASTEDAEFLSYRLADKIIAAPKTDSFTTYVKAGEKVNLSAPEGDIYYTLDGSEPTTESTKFDAANPIIINESLTIKTIAVVNGESSLVAEYDYETIDPNAPNNTIVNDGTDESLFATTTGATVSTIEHVSPDGMAYNTFGMASSDTGRHTIKFNDVNSGLVLAKEAFVMWVKVPEGEQFTFKPSFNNAGDTFEGTIATFDTDNGKLETKAKASEIVLEGFEGYVMLLLDDDAKIAAMKWYDYVLEYGMKSLMLSVKNSETKNVDVAFDSLGFVTDFEKFQTELNPAAIRPDAPYAEFTSGIIQEGTNLGLFSGDNTDIYYTLDGSVPTTSSTKYQLLGMGAAGDISPIEVIADVVIRAIAVRDGISSGVATYTYTVEAKYDGPNAVMVNDCSGEGDNVTSWVSKTYFKSENVDDVSPYGTAYKFSRAETNTKNFSSGISFKINPDLEKVSQIKAFSVYVKIPAASKGTTINLRPSGEGNGVRGTVYAIGNDGTVKVSKNSATVKDFEGVLLFVIGKEIGAGVNYSSYELSWPDFVKEIGFKSMSVYCQNVREEMSEIIIDDITAYYDAEETLKQFDIEGLLADYGISTYENINMMVSNDCSGAKINGGLTAFSDTLTIEKSTISKDNRNIAVKFGNGEAFIEFPNNCKSENAVIGDGAAYWVQLPKGSGKTKMSFAINEADKEQFVYSEKQHHYLIDVDGVISKHEGVIELPDGFRGWIVIPKASMICDVEKSTEITDAKINYESVSTTTLTFLNKDNKLNGKTVYVDDISWYTDFTMLVKSRAYRWEGQVFEN